MSTTFNEDTVEQAALEWFAELGYTILHGPDIAPGEPDAERDAFSDVVLRGRLQNAIAQLNLDIPGEAQDEAIRKLLRPELPSLVGINRTFHGMLTDGVPVEYKRADGTTKGDLVRLFDFDNPQNNDFCAVNQLTVIEDNHNRRPDVVVYVNGLPLAVIELKNAGDEQATLEHAYRQLQTYKNQIGSLFHFNELLVISDGVQARMGSLTATPEWFKVWRTIEGEDDAPNSLPELMVLVRGVFAPARLLKIIRHCITFEADTDSDQVIKIVAGYHQFHAVQNAVKATITATRPGGDQRCGVVWHTQGSGKSLSMLFYAGQIILHDQMDNPTLVVLTDRNDLDDQLFGQFQRCHALLRQMPVQADSVSHMKELLQVQSGGVIFTTIQKFLPQDRTAGMEQLSDRKNIVVITDEAHRSQYDMIDGLARHMRDALPNASFIGFTGTPIEKSDANTRAVFGDYVSVYDIQRAVEDRATVPIYYESRVAKLAFKEKDLGKIDQEFEEVTEGEEGQNKEKLKAKWAALEALVGDPDRLKLIAEDMVDHYEKRCEAMEGKAMIVCMSRRIAVALYNAIIKVRPQWASAENDEVEEERKKEAVIKVIMTGSASDPLEWQQHVRNKPARKEMASRFKDPKDPFKLVIVRDMWLTGFDAPCLTTMYIDKPMRGHGLMQAIARVNRVFRDKPGGLVADYIGIADQLKHALATYTGSGGRGTPSIDTKEAVAVMLEKYEICCDMLHGLDWSAWKGGKASEKLMLLPEGQEIILSQEDGKPRFNQLVADLSSAFALCAAEAEATEIRDDVSFFQQLKAAMNKATPTGGKSQTEMEYAVRQLVAKSITTEGEVIDVFSAAGLKKPDISILSDEFLAEVKGIKQKNLAVDLLKRLLEGEIKIRRKRNVVQSRFLSEMLQKTMKSYHNRAIATQEIIEELLKLARELRDSEERRKEMGLSEDEICFYDALAQNESASQAMEFDELKVIAAELVTQVRKSVAIDWTERESVKAKIRVMVKKILRKHGYPPDLQADAVKLVLDQAEVLCADWAA